MCIHGTKWEEKNNAVERQDRTRYKPFSSFSIENSLNVDGRENLASVGAAYAPYCIDAKAQEDRRALSLRTVSATAKSGNM